MTASRQPPSPEAVAVALPRTLELRDIVRAVIALGVPPEVAAWVTEVKLEPRLVTISCTTDLGRGTTVSASVLVDQRAGLTVEDFEQLAAEVRS